MHPDLFYTYIYYDPSRNNEPIYVGKGGTDRAWVHLRKKYKHPFIQRLQFMKRNGITPIIGIYAGLDEELAYLLEQELIAKFGRKDLGLGSLLNLTDGGEGVSGCKSNKGVKKSDIARKRMSIAKKGKPNGRKGIFKHTDAAKRKMSDALVGRIMNDSWIKKQKERVHTPDTKSKMAESQSVRWGGKER